MRAADAWKSLKAGLSSSAMQGLVIGALFAAAYQGRLLDTVSFDLATSLAPRPVGTPASEIVLIAIDRDDLLRYGAPDGKSMRRDALARLVDELAGLKPPPSWIALDLFFDRESGPLDAALAEAMKRAGNVCIAAPPASPSSTLATGPVAGIWRSAAGVFCAEVRADSDGVIRRLDLFQPPEVRPDRHYALALALKQARLDTEPRLRGSILECGSADGSRLRVPLADDGSMMLALREQPALGPLFPRVAAGDVIAGRLGARQARELAGRIALIGVVDPASPDKHVLPLRRLDMLTEKVPGVELLAQEIDDLLARRFLAPVSSGKFAMVCGVASCVTARLASAVSLGAGLLLLAAAWIVLTIVGCQAFLNGVFFSYLDAGVAVSLAVGAVYLVRYARYGRGQSYLVGALSQYVGAPMAEELATSLELVKAQAERRRLTVLFSDIRGFTTLSESMEPDRLFGLVNEYLSEMTEIVMRNRGHLDKFIGDAVMAFWGGRPAVDDHAAAACEAALEMIEALGRFRESCARRGLPELDVGIGINTGEMLVGNIGSERRLNYTVLGDAVNLASRLEGLTKLYGVRIVLAEGAARGLSGFELRRLDRVRVKGRGTPTALFELMGRRGQLAEGRLRGRAHYEAGLDAYGRGSWKEATTAFESAISAFSGDGPSRLFLERTKAFAESPPPADWDGVHTLESK
ncbi:MAG: adenylate/guanylate cyclase domain-containing protein [Candidatus Wallbacteria bacterium]|nr:adenylate/guanylate cyclase domain-containing protein [Candidatus Wallbacteria bacterium]